MIRNGEYGKLMLVSLIAALLAMGGIACFSLPAAGIALAGFGLLLGLYAAFTHWRYRQIAELCAYLKGVTAGQRSMDLRDNREGELSILKNEIYKLTEKLVEQSEMLKRDKQYLANAISDISHQLKTPMTSMFVMVDLLRQPELPPAKRAEFTGRISRQLERLEWLMDSLLKLSKIDAGTMVFRQERVSAAELVERALEPLAIAMEVKGIRVLRQGDAAAAFTGDAAWSTEALVNILKNCMEHTPEGGSIELEYSENPLHTQIVVKDHGSGILRQDLPHIFERFYRGKNAAEDSVGIGLAMAKALVERQNGDILVESQWGKGTTFTLRFYKRIV